MSVTSHWPSAVTMGFDTQEQFVQLSQPATTNLATTTAFTPKNPQTEFYPTKQFNTVEAYQQQTPLVQQSFLVSQTQPIASTHSQQPISQGFVCEGQYYQPQPQQASSTGGVYYSQVQPQQQQVVVPMVYKPQQPTLMFQNSELQLESNQVTPLVYNPTKQSSGLCNQQEGHSLDANTSHTQGVLNKLIGHEPCIHTLNYLEAQVESQKQIGKAQSEQLKALWEQSAEQENELKRLKLDCSVKDKTIEELRSQITARKFAETQKAAEVPGLLAVIKEQREELEGLLKKSPCGRVLESQKIGGYINVENRSLNSHFVGRQHEVVDNLGGDFSRLNLNQRELSRLQEENQTFRLDIGRLKRENSEIAKLRIEVFELNRKLQETIPLLKISSALDQSISSTGLGEGEAVAMNRTLLGDQIS